MGRIDCFYLLSLLRILSEQVGHLGDGDERMVIDVVDNPAHFGDLESVDDEVDDGLLFIRVIAVRVHEGDAGAELVGERLADSSWVITSGQWYSHSSSHRYFCYHI